MLRVKICGITNALDARVAVEAGADALGFVFAKSPRQVTTTAAAGLIRTLPARVASVGVFVDEKPAELLKKALAAKLNVVQLHGSEPVSTVTLLQKNGFQVVRAFRVKGPEDLRRAADAPADLLLLDAYVPGQAGGTGRTFDWDWLQKVKFSTPFFVSGGLNPGNVRRLLSSVSPYGVDVSSGVEKAPGKKDHALVKEFIRNAKNAG